MCSGQASCPGGTADPFNCAPKNNKPLIADIERLGASIDEPTVALDRRNHRERNLNGLRAKGVISAGTVEGLNNKVKLTTRKSYGFRTYEAIEIALYHNLGALPETEFTHIFW
jgi:Transposase